MIKINIEFICDKCGKSKKEKTITVKGYEEVDYAISNHDSCYMPDGWSDTIDKDDNSFLRCKKCTKEDTSFDGFPVA